MQPVRRLGLRQAAADATVVACPFGAGLFGYFADPLVCEFRQSCFRFVGADFADIDITEANLGPVCL
jgi:hypothetical protein